MAAIVTIVSAEMISAFLKGDLGEEDTAEVEDLLKQDCRARALARDLQRRWSSNGQYGSTEANDGENDETVDSQTS